MAMQAESPAATPTAQVVGNAFVEQYYHILHQSPELVYRFYQDSSVLSRPDSGGVITTTTTMQGINEKILSLNYKDYIAEIKTADAQQSLADGVVVLVTGYLTGQDNLKKKFAQTFFLAPQEKGFYVLNDVFRYVEDAHTTEVDPAPIDGNIEIVQAAVQPPEPERTREIVDLPVHVQEPLNEEDLANEPEVCDPSDVEDGSIAEEEVVDPPPPEVVQSENVPVTSVQSVVSPDDEPKKSYASILKAMKANPSPTLARAPAINVKAKRPINDQETSGFVKPSTVSSAKNNEIVPEKIDVAEEVENFSVYVRNLPNSATAAQVEEVFGKYGPIKQGGVQVRSNKQGFCFGFVEFESLSSMKSAIEASPILIGSRKATVEEKRATGRGPASPNNGRGRYPSSRGGFRSDSFRGRGNFSGGRGYGRNDFRGPSEFSGRSRGGSGRGSEGYQRVDQNGTGPGNGTRQGQGQGQGQGVAK